jgi:phage gpG-like protein
VIAAEIRGEDEVVRRLRALPPKARELLRAEVEELALELVDNVKTDKLTGQVLNVRTGRLRRSIHHVMRVNGPEIAATVGTNVEYAARHEYGFTGIEHVKAHMRRMGDRMVKVRDFMRSVKTPERSFLRSALAGMRSTIKDRLKDALRGLVGGPKG